MVRKTTRVSRFTLWFCVMMSFISCTDRTATDPIVFAVFGDPAELAAYEALVVAFEVEHPDIVVQLRHTPSQSQYRQRLATEFLAGVPPDVMLLNYRRFAAIAAEGGLTPLEPFIDNSDQFTRDDFFPIAIESFIYDDTLWCVPQNLSSLVVYYNRDLFDAANLPYPQLGWDWAAFLVIAQALTLDLDGDGQVDQYGLGVAPNLFRVAPFIWQNGGRLVDDQQAPTRLMLDDPATAAALRWFVDLQTVYGVVPDAFQESAEHSESRFLNGRTAMYMNSRRGVPTYRSIRYFEWDVAPLPAGPTGAAGILHSDAYCLAATTENTAAAWTFIEFANSLAGQTIIARSGRTVPSLIEVANAPAFLDPSVPPANSQVFIDTAPMLRTVPLMPTWPAIEETVSAQIERAFYGRVTLEEALAEAQKEAEPFFTDP